MPSEVSGRKKKQQFKIARLIESKNSITSAGKAVETITHSNQMKIVEVEKAMMETTKEPEKESPSVVKSHDALTLLSRNKSVKPSLYSILSKGIPN